MNRILIISSMLCLVGVINLNAQQTETSIRDGKFHEQDSLSLRQYSFPLMFITYSPKATFIMPKAASTDYESPKEVAVKANLEAYKSVMKSVNKNLFLAQPPKLSFTRKAVKFSLSNPFGFPEGCVPMMNSSFPFIYAVVPGQAPYDNPYTSNLFPKCVESEYDSSTGTYKQVRVDWEEYLRKTTGGYDFAVSKRPVPKMPDNPANRYIH